ncbi:sigma-54 interaction domain-containing protein [Emergencia sp.]|uniref:sigma-54 interaction domain-containing protein n=1 Tax=Emergencia sp. TaxID=1926557 RepID=UPI003AF1D152
MGNRNIDTKMILDVFNDMCCFVITDAKGRYLYANRAWTQTMGVDFEHDNIYGRFVHDLIKDTKINQALRENRTISGYSTITTCDGKEKRAFSIYNPIHDQQGKIIAGAIIAIITGDNEGDVDRLIRELNFYKQEVTKLRGAKYNIENIVGVSPAIMRMRKEINRASKSNSTVLITGETGSGKELVAHSIHALSSRKGKSFIKVNCANIPKDLMESEFFGYEGGAFTGASQKGKIGKFEQADKGSIFLDEINQLSYDLQPKLLRVMQEREFERIGGSKSIDVDVRFIAATNIPLDELVKNHLFRPDLYYRLNVVPIHVPPLRERREDIPLLIDDITKKLDGEIGIPVHDIPVKIKNRLMNLEYSWPGNVRELQNVIEWAINMSYGEPMKWSHFSQYFTLKSSGSEEKNMKLGSLALIEKELVQQALLEHDTKTAAAAALGISRTMLYKKIKKYDL